MDLTGKLLIAMPGMGDRRFEHSVVFLCAHSEEGAMGLIVNKPAQDLSFAQLLEQLKIRPTAEGQEIRVHFGGPVEHGRGFVLHSDDYGGGEATLHVADQFAMTATMDIIQAIARGDGPSRSFMALGYAGWGPGQLEDELAQNGWLIGEAQHAVVFGRANEHKWSAALKGLGIDPLSLSPTSGTA